MDKLPVMILRKGEKEIELKNSLTGEIVLSWTLSELEDKLAAFLLGEITLKSDLYGWMVLQILSEYDKKVKKEFEELKKVWTLAKKAFSGVTFEETLEELQCSPRIKRVLSKAFSG